MCGGLRRANSSAPVRHFSLLIHFQRLTTRQVKFVVASTVYNDYIDRRVMYLFVRRRGRSEEISCENCQLVLANRVVFVHRPSVRTRLSKRALVADVVSKSQLENR